MSEICHFATATIPFYHRWVLTTLKNSNGMKINYGIFVIVLNLNTSEYAVVEGNENGSFKVA
jgi:hypothetical protein